MNKQQKKKKLCLGAERRGITKRATFSFVICSMGGKLHGIKYF